MVYYLHLIKLVIQVTQRPKDIKGDETIKNKETREGGSDEDRKG